MSRTPTRRLYVPLVALLATAAVGLTAVTPSNASAPKKQFHESLAITDSSGPVSQPLAPDTTYHFAFALGNDSRSPQAFGSAQISIPTGYDVVAVTAHPAGYANFTVADLGTTILLTSVGATGTGVPSGSTITVRVDVHTPAAGGCTAALWTTRVKQSNDFSGTGNDFNAVDPTPTTTSGGGRHFVYTTQPSTTQYNVAIDPAVVVTVVDACGNTVPFSDDVTVTDSQSHLATGGTATAAGGAATFANLTFNDFGFTDTLTAAAAGIPSLESDPFDVVQSLVRCAANKACNSPTLSALDNTTLGSISAAVGPLSDVLTTTIKGHNVTGTFPGCDASGEPPLGSVITFNVTTRAKTVTLTLPKAYVNQIPNNGTPFMDICLSLPAGGTFLDKFGHVVQEGLLPNCSSTITTTCMSDRRKNQANEIMTFKLPPGDPHVGAY